MIRDTATRGVNRLHFKSSAHSYGAHRLKAHYRVQDNSRLTGSAVQTEYSLFARDPEGDVLPTLGELGILLAAYSPLGRGFLGARFRSIDDLAPNDWRRTNPRFQGEQFQRNLAIADRIAEMAREKGVTPAQLAGACVLAQREVQEAVQISHTQP